MTEIILHVFANPNNPHGDELRQHVDRFIKENDLSRDGYGKTTHETQFVLFTNLCGGSCCEARREAEARSFAAYLHIFQQTVGRPDEIYMFHIEGELREDQKVLEEVTPPVKNRQIRTYAEVP